MRNLILLVLTAMSLCSCKAETEWISLLDKELSQWDNYLSYRYPEHYDHQPLKDKDGNVIPPIGLNQDPYDVFLSSKRIMSPC